MTRDQWIALIAVIVLLIIAIGVAILLWNRDRATPMAGGAPKRINVTSIMPTRQAGRAQRSTRIMKPPVASTIRKIKGRPA